MANGQSYFVLPNQPESFGVVLPQPNLRKIDFSALEFPTMQRALIEYIKTYYGQTFNDFTPQNGVMMLVDLIAYQGALLSLRSDILADEAFLPTSQTEDAVINHLELIGQKMLRPTPANVDVQCTVDSPVDAELRIQSGLKFSLTAGDGGSLVYELYRAPGDFTNPIIIPPGKRGIVAWGIEGSFQTPVQVTSPGGANQTIDVVDTGILNDPIFVDVTTGDQTVRWQRVDFIDLADATDNAYEIRFYEGRAVVVFGDDVHGKAPLAGQQIVVSYRKGGGIRGRIGAGVISESRPITPEPPYNATIAVRFQNVSASSGGTDAESLADAKKRAPRDFATHNSAVSAEDYAQLVSSFTHPVYGSVLKSTAAIKTSKNANRVELYVLAEGPGNVPVSPSAGMKQGLKTFMEDRNVLTDEVVVLDGAVKTINVEANIVMSRNADAGTVKERVNATIDDFFNIANFDMGQGFYLSRLYAALQAIDGVQFVDIFSPSDDVLPVKSSASSEEKGVAFNELIVLGYKDIRFYFEGGRYDR